MPPPRNSRLILAPASAVIIAILSMTGPAGARDFERLDPNAYQSFVANWSPDDKPLCAVIRNQADWDRVLKPAPTMNRSRPFSPPAEFWKRKAILLVARIIGAGDTSKVFHVERLTRGKAVLRLDYRFTPTAPASSTMKWYLAVAALKPLPKILRVTENRKLICTLRIRAMVPVTPRPDQAPVR